MRKIILILFALIAFVSNYAVEMPQLEQTVDEIGVSVNSDSVLITSADVEVEQFTPMLFYENQTVLIACQLAISPMRNAIIHNDLFASKKNYKLKDVHLYYSNKINYSSRSTIAHRRKSNKYPCVS